MTRKLRVVTWNSEGMFVEGSKTRRATPERAITTIKQLDADIVFIPEFGNTADVDKATLMALQSLGYESIIFPYNQRSPDLGSYGAALLTRLPLKHHILHRFSNTGRQFIEAVIDFGAISLCIIGIHLDDRSEQLRLQQVPEVARIVSQNHASAVIVLGDFNAMHPSSKFARFVRTGALYHAARIFPHDQLSGMGTRVSEMGRGTTINELIRITGLHDLDGRRRRTISAKQSGLEWMPAWRLAKIDWMLGSDNIRSMAYRVLGDVGSDHRPVMTELDIGYKELRASS